MTPRLLNALSVPGYRRFCVGNLGSLLGTWAQRIVVFWLAWEMTRSTVALGLLALFDLLPALIVSPFGGMLADRHDRIRTTMLVQLVSTLPPMILIGASLADALSFEVLLLATALGGLCTGLDHPLRLSVISNLVPSDKVPSAVAVNSMIFNLSRMIGPAIGGLTVTAGAITEVFIFNLASFIVFAAFLYLLRPARAPGNAAGAEMPEAVGWKGVWPGIPFFQRLALLYLLVISLCIRPVFEMLPAFADRIAAGDQEAANAFALMSSALGFGAFVGALLAPGMNSGRAMIGSGMIGVVAVASLALLDSLPLTLLALTIASAAILSNSIATQIQLQTGVPGSIRGKVVSIYAMILRGMPAAGSLLAGIVAVWIDLALVFVFFSVPVVLLALWLTRALAAWR